MPGGDRTGPLGAGPRTGRGMGYCSGYDRPGFTSPAPGFRLGRGGRGRGWQNRFTAGSIPAWTQPTAEQEAADLKAQADWLKSQLDAIQKRIEELES
ncbi:MAG: DUF5320 domain-containing protein [Anaerolineales bacterium]|nr:DUF5320 domain-containing protein [Anaerolineales bacterium]